MMKFVYYLAFFSFLIAGCNPTAKINRKTLTQIPIELLGNFIDDYGSTYTITRKVWLHGKNAKYQLLLYNKEGNYLIAKNDKTNPSESGLYTRIDIMYFEGTEPWRWGYCLTAYKAVSMQDALNTAAADKSNPRKGCNGYPFSRMKPTNVKQTEINGY